MELRELYYYKVIIEEGSILRASQVLHIAQPPLSRMVKKLEDEYNTILFSRGRQLKLTEAGKLLYDRAITILNVSKSIDLEIADLINKENETINLGIVSSSTSFLYQDKLKNFTTDFPKIKFNIYESNTFNLLDMLDKHVINIAITRTPFNVSNYNYVSLPSEPMVLTSNVNIKESISLTEISKVEVIIYKRFKDMLINLFKKNNLTLNIKAMVDDAKTAILLAKSLGIHAIVPNGAYKTFSNGLYASTIDSKELITNLVIITRLNEEPDKNYKALIKYLSA